MNNEYFLNVVTWVCSLQTFSMLRDGQISLSMPILKTPMQNSHLSHIIQVKTTYTLRNYQ